MTAERVRTLLLRGDNLLTSARPERFGRAMEAVEEARESARDDEVAPEVRDLVERRIDAVRQLMGSSS